MQNHQLKNVNLESDTLEDNNPYSVLQNNENDCVRKDNRDKEKQKEEQTLHYQEQRNSEINYNVDRMLLEALEKIVKECRNIENNKEENGQVKEKEEKDKTKEKARQSNEMLDNRYAYCDNSDEEGSMFLENPHREMCCITQEVSKNLIIIEESNCSKSRSQCHQIETSIR